ncbi:MAG: hypothetical protein OEM64_10290 [Gammaproteobacteria bacterium]|nr:hypothetical protein [Gammaproteobacteria bacterium]
MHKIRLSTGARTLAATVVVALLLGGCAQTKQFMSGMRKSSSSEDVGILGAPEADQYLQDMYKLAAGDPATQAEIYADARSASTLTPGPSTNLRYALVLATPGHSESNAEMAQSLLRELLTQAPLMTQAEISLATIHLKYAEQLIVANSEVRRLRAATSRAAQTQEAAASARLTSVAAENRRLRRELEEAEDKLEAITSIERSIRAQDQ